MQETFYELMNPCSLIVLAMFDLFFDL